VMCDPVFTGGAPFINSAEFRGGVFTQSAHSERHLDNVPCAVLFVAILHGQSALERLAVVALVWFHSIRLQNDSQH